jgi:hypothetical protein
VYLQPVEGGETPPQDANSANDAVEGRTAIFSDPYFDLGLTDPWIGLLDTGVCDNHKMLTSPDRIDWMRDCVNGGQDCNNTSDPNFDATDRWWNHGTQSAGILTGNEFVGSEHRGVTAVLTDSWQVYGTQGVNAVAVCRAIGEAVEANDKVLVCEIQAAESEFGAIATAADNAYDTGAILIAANGNTASKQSVKSPAIAHKVLGIGAFKVDGRDQYVLQSKGPADDGRYKPDIQAPTGVESASKPFGKSQDPCTSDASLRDFSGTSCATALAGGAAMLARNWLQQLGTIDNGQTYAFMILYGQNEWPYDNTKGAGPIEMATNGWAWWGKVLVGNHMNIDIPITVLAGKYDFDVALWWPESAFQPHSDIDVYLVDPSGTERAVGYSAHGVFERTGVSGELDPGVWTIRIRGFNVKAQTQPVYWAAHVRNDGKDIAEDEIENGGNPFGRPLRVLADERIYLERREPEEVLHGFLSLSQNQEDAEKTGFSFHLRGEPDEYGVYVAGFDQGRLRSFVGHPVQVVGKRVNLRQKGHGLALWIGSISLDD